MSDTPVPSSKRWPLYALASACSFLLIGGIIALIFGGLPMLSKGEEKKNTLLPTAMEQEEPLSVSAESLVTKAETALSSGNPKEAILLYEKALERGGDASVMRRLFDVSLLTGDTEKAKSVLGLLSFRGIPESVLDALRGLVLLREEKKEEAKLLFEKEPDRSENRFGLLLVSILQKNHGEAKEHLGVLRTSTDPFTLHAARVIQGAYDEFGLFEDGKPEHLETLLARSLGEIEQWPAAEELLQSAVTADPEYRDAQILLGYTEFMMGAPAAAHAALMQAYTIDPEKAETQYFLGLVKEKMGNDAEAATFISYALQNGFTPKRPLRQKLADLAIRRGSYEEAIGQYRAAVDEKDADPGIYRSLITLLIDHRKDVKEARTLALAAREIFGDTSAEVLDLVGWTALLTGNRDEAATFLSTAVTLDPSLAPAWYHQGLLFEEIADREQALNSYRRAYEESIGNDPELAMEAAEKHNKLLVQEENTVSR